MSTNNLTRIVLTLSLFVLLALAVSVVAWRQVEAAPPAQAIPEIVIQGHDFSFIAPDTIEAGLVRLTLENHGAEDHQANLARLNDGKTLDDFFAALKSGDDQALVAMLEVVGGPNNVAPHKRQQTIVDLRPGLYVWICFIPSPDGVPHIAKGMVKPMTVVPAKQPAKPTEPRADLTVTLKDFVIDIPKEIQAGSYTWRVTNAGPELHEMSFLRLAAGKTAEDAAKYYQDPAGPPPFEAAGGIGALSVGKSAWLPITLTPGDYIVLCPIPSSAHEGKLHSQLGMLTQFRVTRAAAGPDIGQLFPWIVGVIGLFAASGILAMVWFEQRKKGDPR